MKSFILIFSFLVSLSTYAAGKLTLNVSLSPVGSFQASTEKLRGSAFKDNKGNITADKFTVLIKSLRTGVDLRDEHLWKHLKSEQFTKAVLTDLKGQGGKATGLLEIAGVKKPVSINYQENGKNIVAKFKVKASDYKLPSAEYMGVGVENDVEGEILIDFEQI